MGKLYESNCYCTNLRRSAQALSDFYDKALGEAGLTVSQYYLLVNLSRMEKANVTHWSEQVGLDRSTMIRNIKVLESRGWLELTAGHGKTFKLSKSGEETLAQAIPIWENLQERTESFLGAEDAQTVLRIGKLLQNL